MQKQNVPSARLWWRRRQIQVDIVMMAMMGFPETSAAFGAMVVTMTTYDINDEDGDKVDHFKIFGAFAAMMATTLHAHDDGYGWISPAHKKHVGLSEMMVMTTTHNNDDDNNCVEHITYLRGNCFYVHCNDFGTGSRN